MHVNMVLYSIIQYRVPTDDIRYSPLNIDVTKNQAIHQSVILVKCLCIINSINYL